MTDTDKRIAEIAERWAKATPGPWCWINANWDKVTTGFGRAGRLFGGGNLVTEQAVDNDFVYTTKANAAAIASAPSDIAYLRSVIDQQREEIEQVRAMLAHEQRLRISATRYDEAKARNMR